MSTFNIDIVLDFYNTPKDFSTAFVFILKDPIVKQITSILKKVKHSYTSTGKMFDTDEPTHKQYKATYRFNDLKESVYFKEEVDALLAQRLKPI